MPQQLLVAKIQRVVNFVLSIPFNFKRINNSQGAVAPFAIPHILLNHFVVIRLSVQCFQFDFELIEISIDWVRHNWLLVSLFLLNFLIFLFLHQLVSYLNINQVLDQIKFLSKFVRIVDDKVEHLLPAKVMGDI